jgi:hypothetical protein
LLKLIDNHISIPDLPIDIYSVNISSRYLNNQFNIAKGIYKMDFLKMISDILLNNYNNLSGFCDALSMTKTLPMVDHTLLNLVSLTSLKKITVANLEKII